MANHIPFLVHEGAAPWARWWGTSRALRGQWQQELLNDQPFRRDFPGPQAYITRPGTGKQEHGQVVPTWNYAVVHAHGMPMAIEDKDWLLAHVSELTRLHESDKAAPWAVADAPADFIGRMLGAIVGIEIPIERLDGKWKAGQNRTTPDQQGAAEGLRRRGDEASVAMAIDGPPSREAAVGRAGFHPRAR